MRLTACLPRPHVGVAGLLEDVGNPASRWGALPHDIIYSVLLPYLYVYEYSAVLPDERITEPVTGPAGQLYFKLTDSTHYLCVTPHLLVPLGASVDACDLHRSDCLLPLAAAALCGATLARPGSTLPFQRRTNYVLRLVAGSPAPTPSPVTTSVDTSHPYQDKYRPQLTIIGTTTTGPLVYTAPLPIYYCQRHDNSAELGSPPVAQSIWVLRQAQFTPTTRVLPLIYCRFDDQSYPSYNLLLWVDLVSDLTSSTGYTAVTVREQHIPSYGLCSLPAVYETATQLRLVAWYWVRENCHRLVFLAWDGRIAGHFFDQDHDYPTSLYFGSNGTLYTYGEREIRWWN